MKNWIYVYNGDGPSSVYRIFRIPDQPNVPFSEKILGLEHLTKDKQWKRDDACRSARNAYWCGDLTDTDTLSWEEVQKWVEIWDKEGWPDEQGYAHEPE